MHATSYQPRRTAFTLVELLVVIGIIALLISILLPTLSKARQSAKSLVCLSQIRTMQQAQVMYANDHKGWLVQAGLGHPEHEGHDHAPALMGDGDDHDDDEHGHEELDADLSWLAALSPYAPEGIVTRCPEDQSPHWPGGIAVFEGDHDHDDHDDSEDHGEEGFRRTSYGINNYLSVSAAPEDHEDRWIKMTQIKSASEVVQFLEMAHTGDFAAADHPELQELDEFSYDGEETPLEHATEMLAVGVHSGDLGQPTVRSKMSFGFLDGHAESRTFERVYRGPTDNAFNPELWFGYLRAAAAVR